MKILYMYMLTIAMSFLLVFLVEQLHLVHCGNAIDDNSFMLHMNEEL